MKPLLFRCFVGLGYYDRSQKFHLAAFYFSYENRLPLETLFGCAPTSVPRRPSGLYDAAKKRFESSRIQLFNTELKRIAGNIHTRLLMHWRSFDLVSPEGFALMHYARVAPPLAQPRNVLLKLAVVVRFKRM